MGCQSNLNVCVEQTLNVNIAAEFLFISEEVEMQMFLPASDACSCIKNTYHGTGSVRPEGRRLKVAHTSVCVVRQLVSGANIVPLPPKIKHNKYTIQ